MLCNNFKAKINYRIQLMMKIWDAMIDKLMGMKV